SRPATCASGATSTRPPTRPWATPPTPPPGHATPRSDRHHDGAGLTRLDVPVCVCDPRERVPRVDDRDERAGSGELREVRKGRPLLLGGAQAGESDHRPPPAGAGRPRHLK